MLILTIPDILGWILIAAAQNLPMILTGRFLQGFAAAGYSPSIWVGNIDLLFGLYSGIRVTWHCYMKCIFLQIQHII